MLYINLAPLVTVAALLGFIAGFFGKFWSRSRRRTAQLMTSADLLRDHLNSLKYFVEHPDAPPRMKEKLLIVSEIASDKDAFVEVLESACKEGAKIKASPEAKDYEKQVAHLRAQNGELARQFETAVSSIVVAMMLRNQGASELIEARLAKLIVDPRKEFAFLAGAIKVSRHNSNFDDRNSNGFGTAAAMA
jgi:hypothetical protein